MNQTNPLGVSPDDQAGADAVARFATESLAPRAREPEPDPGPASRSVYGAPRRSD